MDAASPFFGIYPRETYMCEKRGTEIFKDGNFSIVCKRRKLETTYMTISRGMGKLVQSFNGIYAGVKN